MHSLPKVCYPSYLGSTKFVHHLRRTRYLSWTVFLGSQEIRRCQTCNTHQGDQYRRHGRKTLYLIKSSLSPWTYFYTDDLFNQSVVKQKIKPRTFQSPTHASTARTSTVLHLFFELCKRKAKVRLFNIPRAMFFLLKKLLLRCTFNSIRRFYMEQDLLVPV